MLHYIILRCTVLYDVRLLSMFLIFIIFLFVIYIFHHETVCEEFPCGTERRRSLLPVRPPRLLSLGQRTLVSIMAAEQGKERVDKRTRILEMVEEIDIEIGVGVGVGAG
jgi:hypothetical protein